MKVTNRDVKVFALGMLTLFIADSFYNWKETKADVIKGLQDGWSEGSNKTIVKTNSTTIK